MAKKPFYTAEQVRQIQDLLAAQGRVAGAGPAAKGALGPASRAMHGAADPTFFERMKGGFTSKNIGKSGGGFLT
jgi:hypothetical protein